MECLKQSLMNTKSELEKERLLNSAIKQKKVRLFQQIKKSLSALLIASLLDIKCSTESITTHKCSTLIFRQIAPPLSTR
jgi:hypothetical protein